MASFHCYDNSNVVVTLIKTNFHLYRIQLWLCFGFGGEFLQVLIKGDVVYKLKLGGVDSEKLHLYYDRCFDKVVFI